MKKGKKGLIFTVLASIGVCLLLCIGGIWFAGSQIATWVAENQSAPLNPTIAGNCATIFDAPSEFPTQGSVITADNVAQLTMLEQWGNGLALAIAWSPQGNVLAVARPDEVLLYDGATFTQIRALSHAAVTTLVFSSDGSTLATQDQDNFAQTWNVSTGDLLAKEAIIGELRQDMVGPGGEFVYTLEEEDDKQSLRRLTDNTIVEIYALPFEVTSDTLYAPAIGIFIEADHGNVQLWDARDSALQDTVVGPDTGWITTPEERSARLVTGITVNGDASLLAVARHNRAIELWQLSDKTLIKKWEWLNTTDARLQLPTRVQFSPDGKWLAVSGQYDAAVMVWNVASEAPPLSTEGNASDLIAFSPDSHYFAAVNRDETVTVYDMQTGVAKATLDGSPLVEAFALHPQRAVYALATGEYVDIVTVATRETLCTIEMGDTIEKFTFSPDGRYLVIEPEYDALFAVNLGENRIGAEIPRPSQTPYTIHPTDGFIVMREYQSRIARWNPDTGEQIDSRDSGISTYMLRYRPDSNQIAIADYSGIYMVPDVQDMADIRIMRNSEYPDLSYSDNLSDIVFSPNGLYLAMVEKGGITVREVNRQSPIWDIAEEDIQQTLYSPDGEWLVTVSPGGKLDYFDIYNKVQVRNAQDGTLLHEWTTGPRSVTDIAISPNGDAIYTASEDGTVQMWGVTQASETR